MASARGLVWRAGRPGVRRKKGIIEPLHKTPPEGSVVVCLDEMGPESAKSFRGRQLVHAELQPDTAEGPTQPRERAKQEINYGRRGKGSSFGAFRPRPAKP